jgi:hypothetical protein
VWNCIPAEVHDQIIELALDQSELSPRELAVRFTDQKHYFVSEATVYRLLKAHDLITSPAYVVIKAADELADLTACRLAHPLSQRIASVANLVKDALKRRQVGHDEMARGLLKPRHNHYTLSAVAGRHGYGSFRCCDEGALPGAQFILEGKFYSQVLAVTIRRRSALAYGETQCGDRRNSFLTSDLPPKTL